MSSIARGSSLRGRLSIPVVLEGGDWRLPNTIKDIFIHALFIDYVVFSLMQTYKIGAKQTVRFYVR